MFSFFIVLQLLLLSAVVVAEQQCRLKVSNVVGQDAQPNPQNPFPSPAASFGPSPPRPLTGNSTPFQPFAYGKDKIRGVNLGGWFVLEPWITPSIFENTNNTAIVDEYTFGQYQDFDVALNTLQQHWETWITEDDFKAISKAGLTHVRIPLGYWSIPTKNSVAPFIPGAWPYLLDALNWANKYNIHVILDLHGAPGSQNGYDNSGQRTGNPVWAQNPANVSLTIELLTQVASRIGGMIDILELLNEPAGFRSSAFAATVRQFWLDAYHAVRNTTDIDLKIMIGNAFLDLNQNWQNFLTYPSQGVGVLMDYHEYQIFSIQELQRSWDEHIDFACNFAPELISFNNNNLWTVLGEWSAASTDCAKWLNGRGVGARWDGTYQDGVDALGSCTGFSGDSSTFSADYKAFLRKYWEVQVQIGEAVQGWVWWTWKAENADEWSYQKGLAGGWIPQDPSQRQYPNICNITN